MAIAAPERVAAKSDGGYPTVASQARDWAQKVPDQVIMRQKDFGIWKEVTWSQAWETIELLANGLLATGVDVGDRVTIHSEDRKEWVLADLAAVAIRGVSVGLYPTNPAAEVSYTINDSTPTVHFAEDQEQVDKLFDPTVTSPGSIKRIVYTEPRGLTTYDDPRLIFWDDFLAEGRAYRDANPGAVGERMAEAEASDVMTLVYTSGTTGPPKGAMITNANVQFVNKVLIETPERFVGSKPSGPKDQIVTYLPLGHVAERIFSTWHMVGVGTVLNFAENIELVGENLREIQPTLFFAVPRIWEKLHATVHIKAADASWLKQKFLGPWLNIASWIGKTRAANGGGWTIPSRVVYGIGWLFVYRALRERIGLRRCRWSASGAAPIAPEVLEFFLGLGVNIYELYGMTENSALATLNFPGRSVYGTVGEPYPAIVDGFRLDEETGEIQTKHDGVFAGYWNKPTQTAETFTEDGWLRTGDVGEWVEGTHVRLIDRIKNIIITSGGKNISPSEIENTLKTSPYVNDAMVIGDGRKYLTALVSIEADSVSNWCLRRNVSYTTYRDLTERPEVEELIQEAVNNTNEKFARVEGIKKFRLIPKELDHEDGELTATQKLKRSAVENAFRDLVESMY